MQILNSVRPSVDIISNVLSGRKNYYAQIIFNNTFVLRRR